jgi:hypothetical protein
LGWSCHAFTEGGGQFATGNTLKSALASFRTTVLTAVLMSEQCWYCAYEWHQTCTLSHATANRARSSTSTSRWTSSVGRQCQVAQLGAFLVSPQEKQNDQSNKCKSRCTAYHAAGNSSSRRWLVIIIVVVCWGTGTGDAV